MLRRSVYLLGIILFQFSCAEKQKEHELTSTSSKKENVVKYAKRFAIVEEKDLTHVYLFGNKNNYDTTARFILTKNAELKVSPNETQLTIPCKKIAALSSIYATMFSELGAIEQVVAIDNIDYVNNSEVISRHKQGGLLELARTPQIDLEKTVNLKPDILFTFGMGDWEKDRDKKLEQTGIPVAISVDHLEESPLARAEWIKFFAAFADKKQKADSIFDEVEKNYFELKTIASGVKNKPTVFSEIKYSDSWYMPGGKSFIAQLLNDAGADYLWKDDTKSGSLPLSFEQVFARAKDADFWINLSTLKTKKELLGFESRYAEFKAYKTGNLFNNTRVTNTFGYSNYWETGMIYPNRILSDLILIFHPELKEQIKKELFYYERLN